MIRHCSICLLPFFLLVVTEVQASDFFQFGNNASGVAGQASAVLTEGDSTMTLTAGPAGAVFNESDFGGMGINSRDIAGVVDSGIDNFNLLGGTAAGQTETLTFSFDKPGVLTGLFFDGVKDESFEFFRLELPSGEVLTLFDSQIGLRLNDISSITEPNVTLLLETGGFDDDLLGLSIPYAAGEEFRLVYGEYFPTPAELVPNFTPQTGNGARFQGVMVTTVPSPASFGLLLSGLCGFALRWRRT